MARNFLRGSFSSPSAEPACLMCPYNLHGLHGLGMRRKEKPVDMFQRIALGFTDAVEQAHHGNPDFRVGGRIATLGYPDDSWGMVALTPEQQTQYLRSHAAVFEPAAGAWGLQGATMVKLSDIDEDSLGEALTLAWKNAVEKAAKKKITRRRPRR